jgi:hypothetical protein
MQRTDLWSRWKVGQSLHQIARIGQLAYDLDLSRRRPRKVPNPQRAFLQARLAASMERRIQISRYASFSTDC